jgi:photosystem II stability/assembly factor-like uncharacterized protein
MFLLLSIPLMGSAQTWEDLSGSTGTIANLNGVKFVNPTDGWIAGTGGTILHTTNRGNSWTPQTSGTIEDLTRLAFITSTRGWVVGANGTILRTIDGGTTWTPQTSGTTNRLNGVVFVGLLQGWAVGAAGTILHTTDGGTTWTPQTSGTTESLSRVTFVSATEGWVVGANGTILHTTDGGTTWTPQTSGVSFVLSSIVFVDPLEGWIVGGSGTILHTTDGGTTWTPQTSGVTSFLTGVEWARSSVAEVWAVGQNGTILHTTDGGTTWTPQTSPTVQNLLGIDYPPLPPNGTNIWAVGNSGTLVRYSDSALSVNLSAFDAIVSNDRVLLRWKTESEINNLGFNVYRSTQLDGDYVKVTPTFIAGAGTAGTPHEYSFTDEDVVVGNTYYYYITDMDFSGNTSKSDIIKVIVVDKQTKSISIIPRKFALLQNFPNPFNPETWIPYQIARDASVKVQIYNLKGQSIRTIELGQQAAGTYLTKNEAVYWDGRDDSGEKVASGMYFYTLQAGEFKATKRMVIVE